MALASPNKPEWLKTKLQTMGEFAKVRETVKNLGLNTVCESAHCPNISECWSGGTATFMVMGNTCTRGCRFCEVSHGRPVELDIFEPVKLAKAVKEFNLDYVVITSVDRDDLPDQGSLHFAACIKAVKKMNPNIRIEVLIPDFRGREDLIKNIVDAKPDVIAHNVETVRRLQKFVRDTRAGYDQSLSVLKVVKKLNPEIRTKSSVMLGVGETEQEVCEAMDDLRAVGVDFFTIGQYLRPTKKQMAVEKYVHPGIFEKLKTAGEQKGFLYVASGPFVRSSYRAGELFIKAVLQKESRVVENDI
ncbi:MAG: lipoyl synthase [Candidatus Aenigmarchaeota archaeon]|nr:lipoyl synthase [Candidatus Aenigmarchaeota archaeon]